MKKTKTLTVLFTVLTVMLCSVLNASALATDEINTPSGRIIGISSRGMRRELPENSLEGIIAAGNTGIDFVLTDVSRTADGTLILFADDTTERMLDCDESKNISDMTFADIEKLYLKECSGGAGAKTTDMKVPTLSSALKVSRKNGFALILNTSAELMPDVCNLLQSTEMTDSVVLLVNEKIKDIEAAAAQCDRLPQIIGVKRGNVIFAVLSYISGAKELGFCGVQLKTTNRYGINFNQTVLKRFDTLRAVADPSKPELCGAREDSEKWWDDLISRGYSVIITDEAELFTDYIKRNGAARERLEHLYVKYTEEWQLPNFASTVFNDYKKAYTDAKTEAERLLNDNSVALRELNDCAAALQKAADDINLNYSELEKGTAGTTVSATRIGLCIGAAAAVTAVQIYFFKRRKRG